jgi:hypothetical protein
MDAQAMPHMLQAYLFFVVLPVVLGFTFNIIALYLIVNADLIWQAVAGACRADQPREASALLKPRL